MDQRDGVRRYDDGYRDGRAACLSTGSSSAARLILEARRDRDRAYNAGFEWALWDYEDSNGLGHNQGSRAAIG